MPRRSNAPIRPTRQPTAVTVLRLAYLGILAIATLASLRIDLGGVPLMERLAAALQPGWTPRDAVDALRNVVLFAGWGALWAVTDDDSRVANVVMTATGSGALISLLVESLQLLSITRTASVIDVMTNTGGSFVGAVAVVVLIRAGHSALGRRSFVGVPAFVFAGCYGTAAFIEAVIPLFRPALSRVYGGPADRMRAALDAFEVGSLFAIPLLDFFLFLPAGVFAVAALVERGSSYRRAATWTTLGGILLALTAEVGHGFAAIPIELGAIFTHALAVAAGAWAAARWLPGISRRLRGRQRPAALMFAYTVLVLAWSWRPFMPELDLGAILEEFAPSRWIPLAAHAPRVDLFSVTDVFISFLLYFPLGCLLAAWPLRLRGVMRAFLPTVYLAIAVELGQILVADRFFDITDVLVASASGLMGWGVMKRAGFKPYGETLPTTPVRRRRVRV